MKKKAKILAAGLITVLGIGATLRFLDNYCGRKDP